jgi:hypothetical protein
VLDEITEKEIPKELEIKMYNNISRKYLQLIKVLAEKEKLQSA